MSVDFRAIFKEFFALHCKSLQFISPLISNVEFTSSPKLSFFSLALVSHFFLLRNCLKPSKEIQKAKYK